MGKLRLAWHKYWETYHYEWLIKHHGKFPDRPRSQLGLWVNRHLNRYWYHRIKLPI